MKKADRLLRENVDFIKTRAEKKKEQIEEIKLQKSEAEINLEKKDKLKRLVHDKSFRNAYAQTILPKVNLNVYSTMIASQFFEMGEIGADEPKEYVLEYETSLPVSAMSQHGGAPQMTFTQNGDVVQVNPYMISTPKVHMNKTSLIQGNIKAEDKMKRATERGMKKRIDTDMWTLLRNGLTTTLQDDVGLMFDEDIENYPNANDIDLSTLCNGKLTKQLFIEIIKHFSQLEGVQVKNIYIPSTRLADIYEWVSVTSGHSSGVQAEDTITTALQEQIMASGQLSSMFGYPVNLVPMNTLKGEATESGDEVEIWVSTNKPAGVFLNIPEVAYTTTTEDNRRVYFENNKAVYQFQPPYMKAHYARFVIDEMA